jgi:hypothetical protein
VFSNVSDVDIDSVNGRVEEPRGFLRQLLLKQLAIVWRRGWSVGHLV